MHLRHYVYCLASGIVGIVIGFFIANAINRSEINDIRAQVRPAPSETNSTGGDRETLTAEEIRSRIAEADQNPQNSSYQKNLGLALYRYGALKNDIGIVKESIRLLERAAKLLPRDNDVTVGLGNAWFDVGYVDKDNAALKKAREFYESAVRQNHSDPNVITDIGMTYFLEDPPNDQLAIANFRKALMSSPKDQKALEFIIQALVRRGDRSEALKYLEELKKVDPGNPNISQLESHIGTGQVDAPK